LKAEYPHLIGKDKNRVGSIRLRGEISQGATISLEKIKELFNLENITPSQDISEKLNITKYEPPIPVEMSGKVKTSDTSTSGFSKHDVEQFGIYKNEFTMKETVIITEKIHGTQIMIGLTKDKELLISSKGFFSKDLFIEKSDSNIYWQAYNNSNLNEVLFYLESVFPNLAIQLFGEVVPAQKFKYGQSKPVVLLYDVRIDGFSLNILEHLWYSVVLKPHWVPIVHVGTLADVDVQELCKGKEQVSGKEEHIREGIVVRPVPDRFAKDGTRLMLKVINPAYAKKETGDEIS
jgi:RNA ligase (TIGR02306 family)